MKNNQVQTLAIFGGTGRTGKPLIEQALNQGYSLRVLVRTPGKLTVNDANLTVIQGDIMRADDVTKTISGADAVISVIGHVKGSPKTLQATATRHIIHAMQQQGITRILSLTGAGVRVPEDNPKVIDRIFGALLGLISKDILEDAKTHAELLKASGLEWTLVRGPMLTEGQLTQHYKVGYVGKDSGTRISRADLAHFMLKELEDRKFVSKAPVVTY